MIRHPIAKAQGAGMQRVACSEVTTISRDPLATEYLWNNELPPPELHIERLFEDPFFRTQTCSLESLVFGAFDADLAKIIALGVNAWQQGIAVLYADGSQRGIGPVRVAMEWHSIDGPGGERIISCHPSLNRGQDRMSLWSLRFITNLNRHLIIGNGPYYDSDPDRLPRKENQGRILMGLYCHWGRIDSMWQPIKEIEQLQAIGAFSAYHDKFIGGDIPTDEADRFWYPSPPRGEQRLIGPVFGDPPQKPERPFNEKHESQLTKCASVAWFDCGKPLDSIKLTFCHTQYGDRLPLTSMTFNYTDGTRQSIGPTHFKAVDKITERGHPWCPCELDLNKTDDMKERAHYKRWEWDVNGYYLTGLRVWEGENGGIVGLRFIMDDGTESDTWGFEGWNSDKEEEENGDEDDKEKEPTAPIIELKASRDGFSPALKVWYDYDNGKLFGGRIIAAMQVMEIEKGPNDDLAESFSGMTT
ncbi:uncharacterized protein B0J16DRAFT_379288 [Fusarium flagelliforme]|uniref:Phosphatidylethanolamine n-methyltransferase n=1 Tax=Fusarium flagelliforme TaxID=2675880 RepID=A0A395MQJ4_9HYPO|nr:uncharacterized protein B0J16DRAFT_379288 [Fusarium flagelliforme]KAH7198841.1 hypothetical protein B0J16DRAFT_379288 [Fusarium flagelliforme]RFN50211.1 phosphatidylethanolamine n-methyltransferase [Fusarium flagelliforme]